MSYRADQEEQSESGSCIVSCGVASFCMYVGESSESRLQFEIKASIGVVFDGSIIYNQ